MRGSKRILSFVERYRSDLSFKAIASPYDAFFIDLTGTIHNGIELLPGAQSMVDYINQNGKYAVFITNSARTADYHYKKLYKIGLVLDKNKNFILSSGDYLVKRIKDPDYYDPHTKCYIIGEKEDYGELELPPNRTSNITEAGCIIFFAILKNVDEANKYLPILRNAAARGVKGICPNPDKQAYTGGTIVYPPGYLAEMYEKIGVEYERLGMKKVIVDYLGKPHLGIFDEGYNILKTAFRSIDKNRILVIGDSCETDIAGANRAGLHSLRVLTGVKDVGAMPTYVLNQLDANNTNKCIRSRL